MKNTMKTVKLVRDVPYNEDWMLAAGSEFEVVETFYSYEGFTAIEVEEGYPEFYSNDCFVVVEEVEA